MLLIALTGGPPKIARRARRTRTFEHLGAFASQFGHELLITTPKDWVFHRELVRGWKYTTQNGRKEWKRTTVSAVNAVVYDAMYLADLKEHRTAYRRWKRHMQRKVIPSFNPVLPAKDTIYQSLAKSGGLSGHIPETEYQIQPEGVLARLKRGQSLWLKPTYGSGGRNMLWLRYLGDGRYKVIAERFFGRRVRKTMSESRLRKVLAYAFQRRSYMAQEHIPLLHTTDGRKFDIRVTVQRNHTGQWQVVAMTGRFGAPGSALTNFHAGGRVESLTQPTVEQNERLREMGMVEGDLSRAAELAVVVAERMQKKYPTLGMLGLDIGQSVSGRQYIYDFNGRPGRDILTDKEIQTAMYCVAGYCDYLSKTSAENLRSRQV